MPTLEPLDGGAHLLVEQVYERIRTAIQDGTFPAGSALVESRLAAELNVSKTPIREALARLAREGLAEAAPYRSLRVAHFTPNDAQSILELRAVLEGLAARRACERLDQVRIDLILRLTSEADDAWSAQEWRNASDLVHQVHTVLVEDCGDNRLLEMIVVLNGQYERLRNLLPMSPERLDRSMADHRSLAAAVATRQGVLAEQIMRTHLMSMIETVRDGVAGADGPTA